MLGILLIDKPQGPTSHDIVNTVRRRFQCKRVGHAGSLDPISTGLIAVAVGPATRFLQFLDLEPKEYVGEARFGLETTTQDTEGEIVAEVPVPIDLKAQVLDRLPAFIGELSQTPPMFSAVKVAGKPLYAYARKGIDVERSPRKVFIDSFELVECQPPVARFRVVCSGGTYVRTLFHDLGRELGCGATMTSLRRTHLGSYSLSDAVQLDEANPQHIIPLSKALTTMPIVELDSIAMEHVWHGRSVPVRDLPNAKLVALADRMHRVFAVAELCGNQAHPICVIPIVQLGSEDEVS